MRSEAGGRAPTADREQQDRYGCHNAGRSLSTESTLSTPDPLHLQPPPVQHSPAAHRSLNAPHAAAPNPHFRCAAIPLNPADPRACSDQRAGQCPVHHRTATDTPPTPVCCRPPPRDGMHCVQEPQLYGSGPFDACQCRFPPPAYSSRTMSAQARMITTVWPRTSFALHRVRATAGIPTPRHSPPRGLLRGSSGGGTGR